MLKWLLTVVAVVVVWGLLAPHLKLRAGALPGDVALRFRGRRYLFPFTTTLILSLLASLLIRLI